MKKTMILIMLALIVAPYGGINADTIYKWKDENGVSKFSNSPPPENVTAYETIESAAVVPETPQPENQRRSSYDQMVRQAAEASEVSAQQRKKEAAAKAEEQKRIKEAQQKTQREAERKRLEAEIEAIKKRAVSRTYPNGMKQAQIKALVEQIKNLEKPAGDATQEK